jgi:hypothetical protein
LKLDVSIYGRLSMCPLSGCVWLVVAGVAVAGAFFGLLAGKKKGGSGDNS